MMIIIDETNDYMIRYDDLSKVVQLLIKSKLIKKRLRCSMLTTYDGYRWIKMSGGKKLTTEKIKQVLNLSDEKIDAIKKLLRG